MIATIAMLRFMKGSDLARAAHLILMRVGFVLTLPWNGLGSSCLILDWCMVWIVHAHGLGGHGTGIIGVWSL